MLTRRAPLSDPVESSDRLRTHRLADRYPISTPGVHGHPPFGFTLIEVLIALMVISIGVLSLLALQIHSLDASHDAYLTSIANIQAMDLEERIRANRGAADSYLFSGSENIPSSPSDDGCGNNTDPDSENTARGPQELAHHDLAQWRLNTSCLLTGKPDMALVDSGAGVYKLTIEWDEPCRQKKSQKCSKHPGSDDTADNHRQFIYRFRMSAG